MQRQGLRLAEALFAMQQVHALPLLLNIAGPVAESPAFAFFKVLLLSSHQCVNACTGTGTAVR